MQHARLMTLNRPRAMQSIAAQQLPERHERHLISSWRVIMEERVQ